jgi:hypothetical protein
MEIELLGFVGGWMLARQPDGFVIGIIWSDGSYYADFVIDKDDNTYQEPNELHDVQRALKLARDAYGDDVDLDSIETDRLGRDCWGIDIEVAKKALDLEKKEK